jgi:tyrosyl-tRNA synthetase
VSEPTYLGLNHLATSVSDARRSIAGRGVRVDGMVIEDEQFHVDAGTHVVQLGRRRFNRVTVV